METMHKVKAGIMQVLGFVIIALFAFMTLIGTYQIVTRYFFNRPSTVSEELLTYAFTWMALLASAYVFGKRDHMRMGFLADKLIGAPRKYLEITIDLLTFFVSSGCDGIRRYFHYKADHDPKNCFFAGAYGLCLCDRACYGSADHDFQPYECHRRGSYGI